MNLPRKEIWWLLRAITNGSLNLLDYGARMYNTKTARWLVQDPLAEKYYSVSAYNYCVNNPVCSIDVEGKLVIFINGFGPKVVDLGKASYWNGFDEKVMNWLGDYNSKYFDGSIKGPLNMILNSILELPHNVASNTILPLNTIASNRYDEGYATGSSSAAQIISSLKRDSNGNIIEPITGIAYSMGTVYSKGFFQALIDYVKANPDKCKGVNLTEYNFGAFQAESYDAVDGVDTYQFNNNKDKLNNGKLIHGAKVTTLSASGFFRHSLSDYEQFIKYIIRKNPNVKVVVK